MKDGMSGDEVAEVERWWTDAANAGQWSPMKLVARAHEDIPRLLTEVARLTALVEAATRFEYGNWVAEPGNKAIVAGPWVVWKWTPTERDDACHHVGSRDEAIALAQRLAGEER
jgi:hypothetical protein